MHTKLRLFQFSPALLFLALAPLCPAYAQRPVPQTLTKPTLTVLHEFPALDGKNPTKSLTVGADGALFGTTVEGGRYGPYGNGTVYKLRLP